MNNKYFYLKILKYFLVVYKNNQTQLLDFLKFYNNFINFKNINIFFFNNIFKFKFIFFTLKNKFFYSFYKYYFSYYNLLEYKNYFFIDNKYFTYNNWIYFYKYFIVKMNIKIIIFFDSLLHYKFYNKLNNLNLPIFYINDNKNYKNINYINKYMFNNILLITIFHNYIFLSNKNSNFLVQNYLKKL